MTIFGGGVLFNSIEFFVFLAVVYALYRFLPFRGQNYMLLGASYLFYGWWDWRFLFLIALSTTLDFWLGLLMRRRLHRRPLFVSVTFLSAAGLFFLGLDVPAVGAFLLNGTSPTPLVTPYLGYTAAGLALLFASIVVVQRVFARLDDDRVRRAAVIISLITNLGILGTFKYFNFFADSVIGGLTAAGLAVDPFYVNVILPVGISFYTFQSLSYTIDIYRGEIEPTSNFLDFALFVGYFPQLVAGPIERAKHLLPELSKPRQIDLQQSGRGVFLIILGLFKKVAIADGVAPTVDQIFASSGATTADVIIGTGLFAVQIYCDFSGYSDIARGVSKLFGIDLMMNFNLPYFAKNPQEFWRRWHISLSTWLSDYLYKPLGGNRGNLAFICRNLMLTMLLGGLWHGAAWNFVLWGFYHGSLLSAHRVWTHGKTAASSASQSRLVGAARIGLFFLFTLYGWLLFRANSLAQVQEFTGLLLDWQGGMDLGAAMPRFSALLGLPLLVAIEIAQYNLDDRYWYRRLRISILGFLTASMIFLILMGMSNEPAQFIYFQF